MDGLIFDEMQAVWYVKSSKDECWNFEMQMLKDQLLTKMVTN
jgi:hypothetical protein